MRRTYRCQKCCSCNQNDNSIQDDMLETACNNIPNTTSVDSDSCMCGFDEEDDVFPSNPMLAQSYVPWQTMDKTFTPCVGLRMGTIFPELVSPYMPGDSMKFINFVEETNQIGEGCNQNARR